MSEASPTAGESLRGRWLVYQTLALAIIEPIAIGVAVTGSLFLAATRAVGPWHDNVEARSQTAGLAAAAFLLILGLSAWQDGPAVAITASILAVPAVAVGLLVLRDTFDEGLTKLLPCGLLVVIVFAPGEDWVCDLAGAGFGIEAYTDELFRLLPIGDGDGGAGCD